MTNRRLVAFVAAFTAAFAGAAWQVKSGDIIEDQAGLLERAKVSPEDARASALAAVPGGSLIESEIEEENGRLIYSFEFKVDGVVKEVEVDAITGAVGPVETDDDDDDDDDDDEDEARTGRK